MLSALLGEFIGTAVLILLGNGAVANVLLAKSKGENSGWIVITAGWGFAVMCGILVATAIGSPAHLNPIVTLGFVLAGSFPLAEAIPYALAQLLGAMVGAILVYFAYLTHWRETQDPGLKLACFCTGPAIARPGPNLLTEAIGTFALMMLIFSLGSPNLAALNLPGPVVVGFVVWSLGISLGGPTGYAINPARDLGPRIVHSLLPIAGKSGSDWGYAYVPIFGPIIGAAVASVLALMVIL